MKRTISLGALAAAAVLLVGCSSTSGTAAPSSTSSAPSSSSSAAASAMPSSSASSSVMSSDDASSSEMSSSEAPTSADSSGGDTSSADSSASVSSPSATKTVGDDSGSLDADSTKWFDTFCTGFTPVLTQAKAMQNLGSEMSDPTKAQKTIVDFYTTIGTAFTDTGSKLKDLPAPSFDGGDTFAASTVKAFTTLGPTFTSQAKKIAAVDAAKDPQALTSALSGMASQLTSATAPLQDLAKLKVTPETQAAIEAIPSCAKVKSTV